MFSAWTSCYNAFQVKILDLEDSRSYTSHFQYHSESCHLQKFPKDFAVVGCDSAGEENKDRKNVRQGYDMMLEQSSLLKCDKEDSVGQ